MKNDIYKAVTLNDESQLPEEEVLKRIQLGKKVVSIFPKESLEKLSVWQPAVGCLNRCGFCSQEAGMLLRMLDGTSIRTIAGAFRYALNFWGLTSVSTKRRYKPGIIFPYLDNDIGSYPYLLDYLVAAESLGMKVRISTIGWSRKNIQLNEMHRKIVLKYNSMLAGVRFSLTSYSAGWCNNREEFIKEFINSLCTYRSLLGLNGPEGTSGVCIDIDFKPDIVNEEVGVEEILGFKIISSNTYHMIISSDVIPIKTSQDAFLIIGNVNGIEAVRMVKRWWNSFDMQPQKESLFVQKGKFSQLENNDGVYYGFYPVDSYHPTDGVFFFLPTENRKGGVFDARWPLREFESYLKNKVGKLVSYTDAKKLCEKYIEDVITLHRHEYLKKSFEPMFFALCQILESIDLPPCTLFNPLIIRDRGMIRNSGRAFYQFRQIASGPNIMVVPDPVLCSENVDEVWRIFPAKHYPIQKQEIYMGRKSLVTSLEENDEQIYLVAWAVDSASHSHNEKNGHIRRGYYIPIADFINPMHSFDLKEGKIKGLLPGI